MSLSPHIIVFGNEKGGTGKSTLAVHVAVYLLKKNFSVHVIDVDARQGTISRYFENRERSKSLYNLEMPTYEKIFSSTHPNIEDTYKHDTNHLLEAFGKAQNTNFILVDTPGNNTFLSSLVHSYAHTLVTPLNDSFIDLDVLVRLEDNDNIKPSIYADAVWDFRKKRAMRKERKSIDWIVIRNRLSNLHSKNKEEIGRILALLSKRIGYRLANGFCERVIFKELFLTGMTVLDITGKNQSLSHVAAKQELSDLIATMNIL